MKKIFYILLVFTIILLGCSNDNNTKQEENTIPPELIGTWQFKGIYTHDVVGENGLPLYTAYENGALTTYYDNNTFTHVLENDNYAGTFSIINNTILNTSHFQPLTNSIIESSNEISLLTENVLEIKCVSSDLCDTFRYEKVLPN